MSACRSEVGAWPSLGCAELRAEGHEKWLPPQLRPVQSGLVENLDAELRQAWEAEAEPAPEAAERSTRLGLLKAEVPEEKGAAGSRVAGL